MEAMDHFKMIYRDLPDPGAGLQAKKPPKSAVLIHWATKSVQLISLYID